MSKEIEVQLISGPLNGMIVKVEEDQCLLTLTYEGKRYVYSLGRFAAFVKESPDDNPAGS
ncbi:MAG TPA: hypothetical protein VFK94_00110 [Patescibacteria group bacterium]|nr:hypothetical protein [Patescibacteria group bacterium]